MARLLLNFFLLLLSGQWAFSQNSITLCHTGSTEKFAMFAADESFNAAHSIPRVYVHVTKEDGRMITFKCPDGNEATGYLIQSKKKTDNWIFVFHEWWGLNDNIKRQSEDLFKALGNVNVLALDMFDGKVATDRETASRYMQQFKQERGDMMVKGAQHFSGKNAKIGTLGWCFGGGQSLLASITVGKQADACVMYYGMPVEDVDQLRKLDADVLGIFAAREKWINPGVVKKFQKNMMEAGKALTVKSYDADHGFANPSNAIFDEKATQDAYQHTVEFFRARLK